MLLPFFVAKLSLFILAAPGDPCTLDKSNFFFILPPWWEFLNGAEGAYGECGPSVTDGGTFDGMAILAIGLAVIDMLTRLAGLVAVVVVIAAGVSYMFAQGSVEKTAEARRHIYQALIGLAIVFVAAGFVAFVGNKLNP